MSAPGWLLAEVAEGLQRLIVLRLEGSPPADAIDGVVLAWADALMMRPIVWDEALDAPRIRAGFRLLAARCRRWPAPIELDLPARPRPMALPQPPMNDAQRAVVRARLAALRAKLRWRHNESCAS